MSRFCYKCTLDEEAFEADNGNPVNMETGEEIDLPVRTYLLAVPVQTKMCAPCQCYCPVVMRNVPFKKAADIDEIVMTRNFPDVLYPPKNKKERKLARNVMAEWARQKEEKEEQERNEKCEKGEAEEDRKSEKKSRSQVVEMNEEPEGKPKMQKTKSNTEISEKRPEDNYSENNSKFKLRSETIRSRKRESLQNEQSAITYNTSGTKDKFMKRNSTNNNNDSPQSLHKKFHTNYTQNNYSNQSLQTQKSFQSAATIKVTTPAKPELSESESSEICSPQAHIKGYNRKRNRRHGLGATKNPFYSFPPCIFSTREYGLAMRDYYGMVGKTGQRLVFAGGMQDIRNLLSGGEKGVDICIDCPEIEEKDKEDEGEKVQDCCDPCCCCCACPEPCCTCPSLQFNRE